ncbi:MAG: ribosome-associated translation inhibitor RaiA [Candidatus Acinetobacter avistercoris]|uniref:ribosome hibernation-promoting factor, HPF/YfiA family n=1 Tax=Acinetobacter sp. KS-LM10 TaxID=3120518 RepID=UPI001FA6293B|nr:ribosome-associated translation inhibitor RaiA [Candidatus Acinetobacter avistercoris]
MQITIRGHHLSITPAIEENIRCKFTEMTKHLDQVNSLQVKLSKDHQVTKRSKKGSSNHIAEAIVRLPGVEFFAQATGDDMYASIKKLTEKIKKQLLRYRKMQMNFQPLVLEA